MQQLIGPLASTRRLSLCGLLCLLLAGCEPEVGSEAWCEKMADTPRGDWSVNDATAFAQNCVFKTYDE